jgi:hypothetical protein
MPYDSAHSDARAVRRVAVAALAVSLAAHILVFDSGASLAQTGTTVSDEYPVADPVAGAARFDQSGSAVASNGDGYLVAWTTWRNTRIGRVGDLRVSRVSARGTPADQFGVVLTNNTSGASSPKIAWNGGVYLVVWQHNIEEPNPHCCSPSLMPDVYGARVAADGTVLDPGGFPIAAGTGSAQDTPAVAALGDGFVVAFRDTRPERPGIRAARVSSGGSVVDPEGIDVSVGFSGTEHPGVAANGGVGLVSWVDRRTGNADIRAKRLGADGVLVDQSSFPLTATPADERTPVVAANGGDFLVAWDPGAETAPVRAARVSGGSVLDPGGFPVSDVGSVRAYPTVASDGSGYLVAWLDWRSDRAPNQVRGRRIRADGTFSDASSFVAGSPAGYGSIGSAWGPGGYLVSWDQYVNAWDVFANLVPATGSPAGTNGVLVSTEPNQQSEPAAAFDGRNYLVAWADERAGSDIYAARVTPQGTALDGSGIRISAAPSSQVQPLVLWNGSHYLVAWRDYRTSRARVYAARVTPDGRVLDPDGILVSLPNYEVTPWAFAIASKGSELLAVWRGYDYAAGAGAMYASRVDGTGAVVDHVKLADEGSSPSVGWNGRRYLVTWIGADENRSIHAVRLTARGRAERQSTILSTGPAWKMGPKVASDGADFFVAWADDRSGGMDVYGTRVSDNGRVLQPGGTRLFSSPEFDDVSAVVWDGAHYVVASDLTLIRVTRDAVVVDPAGIPVPTTTPWMVMLTGLAAGPQRDVALLIHRTMPELPYNGAAKAFIRFFHDGG